MTAAHDVKINRVTLHPVHIAKQPPGRRMASQQFVLHREGPDRRQPGEALLEGAEHGRSVLCVWLVDNKRALQR